MLETHLRAKLQPAFNSMGRLLCSLKLTPNTITLIGLITGLTCALFLALGTIPAALALLWISGLCDVLDGTVARLTKKAKNFGVYFDLIVDRVVESAVIIGFALLHPQYAIAYILFLAALLFHFSTFLVASSVFKNSTLLKGIHYDKSLVERAEAFIVFTLMMLYQAYIFEILMLFNLAIFASGLNRFFRIYDATTRKQRKKKQ